MDCLCYIYFYFSNYNANPTTVIVFVSESYEKVIGSEKSKYNFELCNLLLEIDINLGE